MAIEKKYLIISGDDYGLTRGVSEGILDGLEQKGLSETNFIATTEYSADSLSLAKKRNLLKMGIHLNITLGYSLYYNREMDYFKEFLGTQKYYTMIENEFFEQAEFLIKHGIQLTHLTYHKNIIANMAMTNIIKNLALEYKIPVRRLTDKRLNLFLQRHQVLTCDKKLINENGSVYSLESLAQLLKTVGDHKYTELVCHPGYVTPELSQLSSMVAARKEEWILFTSAKVKCMIEEMGFELINYTQLKD